MDPDVLTTPREGMTLRDYARVLARRWWLIALVAAVAAVSAFVFSWVQTPVYEATAEIMYQPRLDVANPLAGTTVATADARQAELEAVVTVVSGPELQQLGDQRLREEVSSPAEYELTAQVEPGSATSTSSSVTSIAARSDDPATAQAAANAFAAAFIDYRKDDQRQLITEAIKAVRAEIADFPQAARSSPEYLTLTQRLQDLLILRTTVTGDFKLVVPATLPQDPVEPRPLRSAALGLAIGLFAGVGLAFLLEQFDTRLRDDAEITRILGMPVLSRVPRFPHDEDPRTTLVVLHQPSGPAAEAFRLARGNLEFVGLDADAHSIAVTSAQLGEGKTVTACNLAAALAMAGKRVVLVDADLRRSSVHKVTGVPRDVGLTSVLAGRVPLRDALQRVVLTVQTTAMPIAPPPGPETPGQQPAALDPDDAGKEAVPSAGTEGSSADPPGDLLAADGNGAPRFYVLAAGPHPPNPGEMVASQRFAAIVEELKGIADVVLVDTPPVLAVGDTAAIARAVGGLVFVVDTDMVRRPTLEAATERLDHLPCARLGVILMRFKVGRGSYRYYRYGHAYDAYYQDSGNGKQRGVLSRGRSTART